MELEKKTQTHDECSRLGEVVNNEISDDRVT